MTFMEECVYKDVVIVGNGPSAITLSYMLAGNWPYYNGFPHPNEFLQYRLEENKEISVLQQDLEYLSEGLEGRSLNPVSVLYDNLVHPEADLGNDNPSVISWKYESQHVVDHVAIGKGFPGGSWHNMESNTLTISLGSWMELPNLSIKEWDLQRSRSRTGSTGFRQKRATVGIVAEYYENYVNFHNLRKYFIDNAVVTSVSKVNNINNLGDENLWKVSGYKINANSSIFPFQKCNFNYITPHVVMATGNNDHSKMLNIEGENYPFVLHSLFELEKIIQKGALNPNKDNLLIIGAGLSAADAVITSRFHDIPTIHVFRRDVWDPDLVFNKLSQNVYPEYHKVHQMMQDSNRDYYEGYKAFPSSKVIEIKSDGTVVIMSCIDQSLMFVKVSYVLVLIGMLPDLSFLSHQSLNLGLHENEPVDGKHNPVDIKLYNHESVHYPGLFAIGPLVGDNFVRFVQGGCLAVASYIVQSNESRNA